MGIFTCANILKSPCAMIEIILRLFSLLMIILGMISAMTAHVLLLKLDEDSTVLDQNRKYSLSLTGWGTLFSILAIILSIIFLTLRFTSIRNIMKILIPNGTILTIIAILYTCFGIPMADYKREWNAVYLSSGNETLERNIAAAFETGAALFLANSFMLFVLLAWLIWIIQNPNQTNQVPAAARPPPVHAVHLNGGIH